MGRPRTNKSTIKNDPFGSVIPMHPEEAETPRRKPGRPKPAPVEDTPPPPEPTVDPQPRVTPLKSLPAVGKQKLTVHLDADVVNRLKNAAYWNPRLTITRIAEQGVRQALKEVEKENGGVYPQRDAELVGGRPIK